MIFGDEYRALSSLLDTLSEYVIIIAFPREQWWLRERV